MVNGYWGKRPFTLSPLHQRSQNAVTLSTKTAVAFVLIREIRGKNGSNEVVWGNGRVPRVNSHDSMLNWDTAVANAVVLGNGRCLQRYSILHEALQATVLQYHLTLLSRVKSCEKLSY